VKLPKALLVDLDGTLVDTGEANYRAYAEALAAVGVTLERSWWKARAEGRSWRQFLPELLEDAPAAEQERLAGEKARLYPAMLGHTRLNEGLAALIASGRSRWRTALVTTASPANVTAVLAHHDIAGLFDTVVTGGDVERHKPAPDAYLLAAARLSVAPSECIAFEDMEIGERAATAAGARCVRVSFSVAAQEASTES
jgi:HAD superfamily hydrolase (TIGR01509 family)